MHSVCTAHHYVLYWLLLACLSVCLTVCLSLCDIVSVIYFIVFECLSYVILFVFFWCCMLCSDIGDLVLPVLAEFFWLRSVSGYWIAAWRTRYEKDCRDQSWRWKSWDALPVLWWRNDWRKGIVCWQCDFCQCWIDVCSKFHSPLTIVYVKKLK